MSEWKPIETAPKDGTEIILHRGGDVFSGFWGLRMRTPGWLPESSRYTTEWATVPGVTHWMEMPQPPAGGATAGRAQPTATDPPGDAIEPIISQATGG